MPRYSEHEGDYLWVIRTGLRTTEAYPLWEGKWLLELTLKEGDSVRWPQFDAMASPP